VNAGIFRELRMEGGGHGSSLPDGDGIWAFGGEDLYAFSDMRDFGSANENHFQRRFVEFALQIADKPALADGAVDLTSIGVAADTNVERAEPGLGRILDFVGEEDGAGTGSESRLEANELFKLFEAVRTEQFEEGARFASRDHEAVDVVELLGPFYEDDFGPQLFEPAAVRVKIAL